APRAALKVRAKIANVPETENVPRQARRGQNVPAGGDAKRLASGAATSDKRATVGGIALRTPCRCEESMGRTTVKLGLLTAPFSETPLDGVADWASSEGFEALEIACWPKSAGPARRYAGTSHIDVAAISASEGKEVV